MKKILYSAFVISLLGWGCTKETRKQGASAHELRMSITRLDPSLQRKVFRAQSAEVKSDIWKDKFENILSHEWSPAQLKMINELKEEMAPQLFVEGSAENLNFAKNFSPRWKERLKVAFGPELAENLFGRLENMGVAQRAIVGDPDCACSKNDDWCIGKTCTVGGCNTQNWGCGTIWIYYCTGICH